MNPLPLEDSTCEQFGLEWLDTGNSRAGYRRGRWVYKVPINEKGTFDNWREAKKYARTKGRDPNGEYARCRLLKNGWLVMEYVEPLHPRFCPRWADFIDCQQVGTNRHGGIVAYDYA